MAATVEYIAVGSGSLVATLSDDPPPGTLAAWDDLAEAEPSGDVTQLSGWARVRGAAGYEASYLAVHDEGRLVGGAQILFRSIPIVGRIGYIAHGPLVHPSAVDDDEVRRVLVAACAHIGRERATMLIIQPPERGENLRRALLEHGFRPSRAEIAPSMTLRLDLTAGEEELRAGLSKRLRRWTRQWSARGVVVRDGHEDDVELLARFLAQSGDHHGFDPLSASYLARLHGELGPAGHATLLVGEVSGRPVAASLFTASGGTVRYRLTGLDRSSEAARLKVPAAIVWEAIRRAKAADHRVFDLGGVSDQLAESIRAGVPLDLSALDGPDFFKASFGGRPLAYPGPVELIGARWVRMAYDRAWGSPRGRRALEKVKRSMRTGRSSRQTTRMIGSALFRRAVRPVGVGVRQAVVLVLFRRVVRPAYVGVRQAMVLTLFDRRLGVDTTGELSPEDLGYDAERVGYRPAGLLSLRRVLPPRLVGPDDVFVDFGAGKGRVVLQASMYRCRRVIGVELSESLHRVASRNLDHSRGRLRCQDVVLVCGDVLDFAIPDDLTIAHFNNPFRGAVFARVIEALVDSVDRNPRTVLLVYANPVEEGTLMATGRIRPLRTARGLRPTPEWSRSNSTRLYVLR